MSTQRQVLEQALEALENVRRFDKENLYGLDDDITALRAALAEPQDSVAWAPVTEAMPKSGVKSLCDGKNGIQPHGV